MQNWWQLTAIQFSLVAGLPPIMIGYLLTTQHGFFTALLTVIMSGIILSILGFCTALLSLSKRLTTIEYAEIYLGKRGTYIFSLAMGIVLFGWFIINLNLTSQSIITVLQNKTANTFKYQSIFNYSLAVIITLFVINDIKSISRFAYCGLFTTLLFIIFLFFREYGIIQHNLLQQSFSFDVSFAGLLLLFTANLSIIGDMPTYYRFAKSKKDALIAVLLTFLIILPTMTSVGMLAGLLGNNLDIQNILTTSNGILDIFIISFLFITCIMLNNGNIYSCSKAIKPLFPSINYKKIILVLGLAGGFFSSLSLFSHFSDLLEMLTLLLASMSIVIITNFCFDGFKIKHYDKFIKICNFFTTIVCALYGLLSLFLHTKLTSSSCMNTSIASLISVLIYRGLYAVFNKIKYN